MIILDFNQVIISKLMQHVKADTGATIDEHLIRHVVLAGISSYRQRFKDRFGELVFCADDYRHYWRKDVFPYYKINRKRDRDRSGFDWPKIFQIMNKIREELKETFPYKVVYCDGAEADDAIGTIVKHTYGQNIFGIHMNMHTPNQLPTLIISGDKDFLQLQKYKQITQYSPIKREFLQEKNPYIFLKQHIMRGDPGDGIPNFLSPDAIFVTEGTKQKSLYKNKVAIWLKQKPEEFCDEETLKYYRRNEQLIDLDHIPSEVTNRILTEYEKPPIGSRSKLLSYFIKHKLRYLTKNIQDF